VAVPNFAPPCREEIPLLLLSFSVEIPARLSLEWHWTLSHWRTPRTWLCPFLMRQTTRTPFLVFETLRISTDNPSRSDRQYARQAPVSTLLPPEFSPRLLAWPRSFSRPPIVFRPRSLPRYFCAVSACFAGRGIDPLWRLFAISCPLKRSSKPPRPLHFEALSDWSWT